MADIIEITDFMDPRLDIYARCTEGQLLNRHEPDKGIFIAESPMVIKLALDSGCEPISFLAEKRRLTGDTKAVLDRCENIPVFTAEFDLLTQLTGFKLTRGMLCAMRRPKPQNAARVCAGARRIAVLENIVNPTNIGAIFRSAAALYIDGVILTPACSDPLYRRAVRVSMGTVFQVPWAYMKDEYSWPHPAMEWLHSLGFKTAAMALNDHSRSIDDPQIMAEEKLAIVLGTEGDGLAEDTVADCDYTVRIPMSHGVDSLNVAAASAVAFWQLAAKNRN
ncbi:MAG TPA: RNA methyltransferase [Candidatus Scybalocola faecavium]|nr:RNA methyltransferase [Candidatus Scybalocola faecavium]